MKNKFLSLALCILLLLGLTGCKSSYPSETDMEYMVSSIGFDKAGNIVTVFAEIIVINSNNSDDSAKTQIFKADGKNPKTALYNITSSLSKPLMLKHCGLLILGDGIDGECLTEIFGICLNNKDITGAIKIVATKSAESLINIKPLGNIALGYEISEALKQNADFSGAIYKNRFYEVEANRESMTKVFCLPYFKVLEDKHKIDGIKIYKNDTPLKILKEDDAVSYLIMSKSFSKGTVKIGDRSFLLKLKNVDYDIKYKNSKLFVKVSLDVETEQNNLKLLRRAIENNNMPETDIYYILDRIKRKDGKIFEDVKDNYEEIYKNAEVTFEVNQSG